MLANVILCSTLKGTELCAQVYDTHFEHKKYTRTCALMWIAFQLKCGLQIQERQAVSDFLMK